MDEQTESTEVIQNDLDETRASLADKLAQLGDKITGTVENVGETVENVTERATETVETVKETVDAVKDTVSGTVENVKDTVSGTVETVKESVSSALETIKETFNLQRQVEERPWLVMSGAVLLGFVGGKLIGNLTAPRERHRYREYDGGRARGAAYQNVTESSRPQQEPAHESSAGREESSSHSGWLENVTHNLSEHLGPELNNLKGLALGTLFGVARDMVTRNLPRSLKDEVGNVFNSINQKLGGKKIEGPVFGDTENGQAEEGQHRYRSSEEPSHHECSSHRGQESQHQPRSQGVSDYSNRY
jgi:hypothetical protein